MLAEPLAQDTLPVDPAADGDTLLKVGHRAHNVLLRADRAVSSTLLKVDWHAGRSAVSPTSGPKSSHGEAAEEADQLDAEAPAAVCNMFVTM